MKAHALTSTSYLCSLNETHPILRVQGLKDGMGYHYYVLSLRGHPLCICNDQRSRKLFCVNCNVSLTRLTQSMPSQRTIQDPFQFFLLTYNRLVPSDVMAKILSGFFISVMCAACSTHLFLDLIILILSIW